MESHRQADDEMFVEGPSTLALCFVLAIVLGYFSGRTFSVLNRNRIDPE